MRQILIAVGIALTVSILLTPVLIWLLSGRGFGREIRVDGPATCSVGERCAASGTRTVATTSTSRLRPDTPARTGRLGREKFASMGSSARWAVFTCGEHPAGAPARCVSKV